MDEYKFPIQDNMYSIVGGDSQVVNIRLAPDVKVQCEPGVLMHMDPRTRINTNCSCSISRYCSGEDQFRTTFTNPTHEDLIVGLTPNRPAKVIPVDLANLQGAKGLRCRQGAWMASMGKVNVSFKTDCCNWARCCCGGQGAIQMHISGSGIAFLEGHGTIMMKLLGAGEKIVVDEESVLAWADNLDYGVRTTGGCCTCCCSGEGYFNAVLSGGKHGGIVILESMPFEKYRASIVVPPSEFEKRG